MSSSQFQVLFTYQVWPLYLLEGRYHPAFLYIFQALRYLGWRRCLHCVLQEATLSSVLFQAFFLYQVSLLYLLEGLYHQVIGYAPHALHNLGRRRRRSPLVRNL